MKLYRGAQLRQLIVHLFLTAFQFLCRITPTAVPRNCPPAWLFTTSIFIEVASNSATGYFSISSSAIDVAGESSASAAGATAANHSTWSSGLTVCAVGSIRPAVSHSPRSRDSVTPDADRLNGQSASNRRNNSAYRRGTYLRRISPVQRSTEKKIPAGITSSDNAAGFGRRRFGNGVRTDGVRLK
jgi:hypothetical protein